MFSLPETLRSDRRPAALALMVRKWAPYARPGFIADWQGARAAVFVWDAAQVEAAAAAQGLSPAALSVLPETVLREKGENGVRLVEALDGFEAQLWSDGFLAASRWWPTPPGDAQWQTFLRAAGVESAGATPPPTSAAWLERPWIRRAAWLALLQAGATPPRLAAALALFFLAPSAFFVAKSAALSTARGDIEAQIARESQGAETILDARRVATANRFAIEQLVKLQLYPPPLAQMAEASGIIAASNLKTESWEYDNGTLSIMLRGQADAAALVRRFEDSPMFAGVASTTAGGENVLQLRMNVEPLQRGVDGSAAEPEAMATP